MIINFMPVGFWKPDRYKTYNHKKTSLQKQRGFFINSNILEY
jgi:hypothetical protein